MRRLLARLRRLRNDQKGFTLIEMLVVISILGILAAIVTMSMVGITNLAQTNANNAELKTVQVALDTMASEQQVDADKVCTGTSPATPQMDKFPDGDPATAPLGSPVSLYPRYLRTKGTHQSYACTAAGVVSAG